MLVFGIQLPRQTNDGIISVGEMHALSMHTEVADVAHVAVEVTLRAQDMHGLHSLWHALTY